MVYKLNRRNFILKASAVTVGTTFSLSPQTLSAQMAVEFNDQGLPRYNVFSYRSQNWKDHFDNLKKGAILADIECRCLHFWHEDGETYKVFPTSVPLTEELTKRGNTTVSQKIVGPVWRPTKAMLKRDPQLPDFMPAGPDNPLGSHALYLGWPSYRIHGTSDTRKIGRQSSSGCIGLYNEQIVELFSMANIGTQVKLI
jgi:lipoprotein-anchoring transpeptidase ErfK/SrfK